MSKVMRLSVRGACQRCEFCKRPIQFHRVHEAAEVVREYYISVLVLLSKLNGITPTPTAQEVVNAVQSKIPEARIDFQPQVFPEQMLGDIFKPSDDSAAQNEWGWKVEYDLNLMLEDMFEVISN